MDMRMETKRDGSTLDRLEAGFHQEEPVWNGKRFSEMSSKEMMAYMKE